MKERNWKFYQIFMWVQTNHIAESSSQMLTYKNLYVESFFLQQKGSNRWTFENGAGVVGEASSLSSRGLEEMLIAWMSRLRPRRNPEV